MNSRALRSLLVATAAAGLAFAPIVTAALAAQPAQASANKAAGGVPGWKIASPDFAANPKVLFGSLPNGMRYAIQRHEMPKGEISIRFGFLAGSKDESDSQRGAAHFVEHMAF